MVPQLVELLPPNRNGGAAVTLASPVPRTLAVVDMGSNSFRLEVGRVEGEQIFRLDTWRETLRIGAHVDEHGRLSPLGQQMALACLGRFAERLQGLHPSVVRAIGTNAFRTAQNAAAFLTKAEKILGFPIDVISGHEEARLIYAGVAHVLPPSDDPRLVIDIGGGSTPELIVGTGLSPDRLESLQIGCVDITRRFFAQGRLTDSAFRTAETAARAEIESIPAQFMHGNWKEAHSSSGTALALADILEQNGMSEAGITRAGLAMLRRRLVAAGDVRRVSLRALKPQRAPVLAGGLAIMSAALDELGVETIHPVGGALRLGAMYDMLGRTEARDIRIETVERFMMRYHVDAAHARRVANMAVELGRQLAPSAGPDCMRRVAWAALLHEIGLSVSHAAFHKHGAYILKHADMPGFAAAEQEALSRLVLGGRGGLAKMAEQLRDPAFRAQLLALRLAGCSITPAEHSSRHTCD